MHRLTDRTARIGDVTAPECGDSRPSAARWRNRRNGGDRASGSRSPPVTVQWMPSLPPSPTTLPMPATFPFTAHAPRTGFSRQPVGSSERRLSCPRHGDSPRRSAAARGVWLYSTSRPRRLAETRPASRRTERCCETVAGASPTRPARPLVVPGTKVSASTDARPAPRRRETADEATARSQSLAAPSTGYTSAGGEADVLSVGPIPRCGHPRRSGRGRGPGRAGRRLRAAGR